MSTAERQASRAHVCTTKLFAESSIWIKCAADERISASVLWQKSITTKSFGYRAALIDGWSALEDTAKRDEKEAINRGLLLHIGVDNAIKLARQLWSQADCLSTAEAGATC